MDVNRPNRPGKNEPPPRKPKGIVIVLIFGVCLILLLQLGRDSGGGWARSDQELDQIEFTEKLKQGQIKSVRIDGSEVTGELPAGNKSKTYKVTFPPSYFTEGGHLEALKQTYEANFKSENGGKPKFEYQAPSLLSQVLISLLPWILLIVLAYFLLFRQMRASGPGSILSFGRSRARVATQGPERVTFDDVAGCDEAKEEVQELVEFLKDPAKFTRLGARIPRGILLVGVPGTGKTLMAKAVAGEADVPFYAIGGSDFVEMFVGVGASRVRDLFRQAKENAPSIIFLDEIDAVGRRRGVAGFGRGDEEREQTLNAILVEMDGFDTDDSVIVMAASNRPDVLDPALLRPGRFDREIALDLPDVKGREEILRVHARKVRLAQDVDLSLIARGTPGFSGADLEAVINEAALLAVMKKKDGVEIDDLEEARDKVRWGREKRSKVMDVEEKKVTAYHEAGHAVVAASLPNTEPVHKVTIIPRGVMGGATMFLPEKDRHDYQKAWLLSQIKVLFAGRLAEEEFCGDISAGARNDIQRATDMARRMVCEWGMSDLGPIDYSEGDDALGIGREPGRPHVHSEATAVAIDAEVKKILNTAYEEARVLLKANRDRVERIAKALIKYEVLDAADVRRLMEGADVETLHDGKKAPFQAPPRSVVAPVAVPAPAPATGGGTNPLPA